MKYKKVITCRACELNDCMGLMLSLRKHQAMGTIHPDCPLDDLINPLNEMGVKNVLFKLSRRVPSDQFDSRSFVGDIVLELRGLLFENEKSFRKEYDEWEIKNK